MIKKTRILILLSMLTIFCGYSAQTFAQQPYRVSDRDVQQLLRRIDTHATQFKRNLDNALDRSRYNGTSTEDEINRYVQEFDNAANRLRQEYSRRDTANANVQEVLNRGWAIDNFMKRNRLNASAERSWQVVRTDLRSLADIYRVSWRWEDSTYNPYPVGGVGNTQPYRVSDREVQQLLRRMDTHATQFKRNLDYALDRSRYNGTSTEDEINRYVQDFDNATNRLRQEYSRQDTANANVQEVLNRGWAIDNFMKNNRLNASAERSWQAVRTDLRSLADIYRVSWRWEDSTYNPYPVGGVGEPDRYPRNGANRITGTYTLDASRSEDATTAIDRVTRNMDTQDRDRLRRALERRLDAPQTLAIDRNGRRVIIASTTAPQAEFDADGREQVETRNNGRTVRTTASFTGDMLIVNSQGDAGNDYYVSFDPIENGRALRVTRRFYNERLTQPVEVQSVYRKTDDVARWNIYTGTQPVGSYPPDYNRPTGRYGIPNNVTLTAVLNNDLSTGQTRDGDRFTMTVRSPNQYDGAVIEGYVSKVERSGRVTGRPEIALNFQNIRLRDGGTYEFAGFIESVRTTNGEEVKVDNEGSVRDTDSQTTKTVTRSGIGAAIGAIIGGIAGGGQGAAIGAVVGAGAGAGTVFVQGREDINLVRGSEFTITTSAPRTDR